MPKNFLYTYWKTILLCVVIFILSSVTFKSIPDVAKFHNSDKITHILMYAALGFIAYYEYTRDIFRKENHRQWLILMFLFFVLFGGVIEILQGTIFKPRTAEFADWVGDILGLAIGAGLAKLLFRKVKYK